MSDREKLIELLMDKPFGNSTEEREIAHAEDVAEYLIANGVTVRERGHKVVRERHRGIAYAMECPVCNSKIPSNKPYTEKVEYCSVCEKRLDDTFQNFCPNCGADMRTKGEGEEDG